MEGKTWKGAGKEKRRKRKEDDKRMVGGRGVGRMHGKERGRKESNKIIVGGVKGRKREEGCTEGKKGKRVINEICRNSRRKKGGTMY